MKNTILTILVLNLLYSCSPSDSINDLPCTSNPTLKTKPVSEITFNSAVFNGSIIAPNCDTNVISQGFVYSKTPFPDTSDNIVASTTIGENLAILVKNLDYNEKYYVRTFYLTNSGEFYGNEVEFGLLYAERTYVPDDNFEKMLIANGYDDHNDAYKLDNYVVTSKVRTAKILSLNKADIKDLTGIEDFLALEELYISYNQITALDISNNKALIKLDCQNNKLTSLDLSQNINLNYLDIGANQISTLNLNNNINLFYLYCFSNQLSVLDLRYNSKLKLIHCRNNQLSKLDVSSSNVLLNFYYTSNPITCIQVNQQQYNNLLIGWYGSNWDGYTNEIFSLNCN